MKHLLLSGLVAASCLGATETMAASVQSYAQASGGGCGLSGPNDIYGWSAGSGAVASSGACTTSANATTGPGYTTVIVSGGNGSGEGNLSGVGNAQARQQVTLQIDAPQNYGGNGVALTVQSHAHGTVNADQNVSQGDYEALAWLEAILTVSYYKPGRATMTTTDVSTKVEAKASAVAGTTPNASAYDVMDELLKIENLLIDPLREIKVGFNFKGGARYLANEVASGSAAALGGSTFGFAPQAFIFGDPGFSVSFADAAIVNNQWIDPRGTPAVPLPAPALLLLGGFGALAALRRRS
ncbi:VPLPA-CTERM sorting domain-containing protein [Pseudooceanicola onchidii]|uniref:VPLPA-CTERM sorting domain-containing protein n=1 Tax=Pseudooceanicola onchidii TaxID=2562279 RepID=UPI001F10FBDD|nr:VPLPA-CTERM sorting domain-containing protein [Pseudooceanicola onchidii]